MFVYKKLTILLVSILFLFNNCTILPGINKSPNKKIGYSISRKYRPIWVSVSVLDLNQNSGFVRTLRSCCIVW